MNHSTESEGIIVQAINVLIAGIVLFAVSFPFLLLLQGLFWMTLEAFNR